MKDKFKRIFDTFKNKKKCHYLLTFTLESLMHLELKENIIKCLNDKIGLSLFQMEWMVMRANQYFTILINDPLIPIHVVFNKTYLDKYSYDCSAAKTTHHFYHPLEVLCTECGFCSYEEIGNIYYYPNCYIHLIYYYIPMLGFDYFVTHTLETELLLLYILLTVVYNLFTYIIRLAFIFLWGRSNH